MGKHTKSSISVLEKRLDERLENLKKVMRGRDLHAPIETSELMNPEEFSWVNSEEVTIAIDDFKTILASVKRTLK